MAKTPDDGRLEQLTSVLFGVSATDATSFARALALVLGVVIVATLVPAWRAAQTNPLTALRHQYNDSCRPRDGATAANGSLAASLAQRTEAIG